MAAFVGTRVALASILGDGGVLPLSGSASARGNLLALPRKRFAMRILVASSSVFRQQFYQEVVEKLGHEVSVTSGGLDCVNQLRSTPPDLLILEAPLHWGGSEGVLEVAQHELRANSLPVILVAVGAGPIDWFQLSRFRIDDFLFRLPTLQELGRAVSGIAERQTARGTPLVTGSQETALV